MDEISLDKTIDDTNALLQEAAELIRDTEGVLTYPMLLKQYPGIDTKNLVYKIDYLIERGYPIQKIEGKGFVNGNYSIEDATKMIREQFINDVIAQVEACETYIKETVYGIEYTLIENSAWPTGIQRLLIVNNGIDDPFAIPFQERSISYPILKVLLINPNHVITNYEIAQLVRSLGEDVEFFDYLTVFRWFDYLRRTYGIPLTSVQSMGWGMTNIQVEESAQGKDMETRINSQWQSFFEQNITSLQCSTIAEVSGITFYFPKLEMGHLARHAFVVTIDQNGATRMYDLQTRHSTRRVLESFVRNGGYIDKYTVAKHSKEEWWQAQQEEDQRRSDYISRKGADAKDIDVAAEDGFDYAMKRLRECLTKNGFPELLGHAAEAGYVLSTNPKYRRQFIKDRTLTALEKLLGRNFDCRGYPAEYGLDMYRMYPEYDMKVIVVEIGKLENKSEMEMFQPSIFKTHVGLFNRVIYKGQDVFTLTVVIELNPTQAELLCRFGIDGRLDTTNIPKRERDLIRKQLERILYELKKSGVDVNEGTGIVKDKIAILPIPMPAES